MSLVRSPLSLIFIAIWTLGACSSAPDKPDGLSYSRSHGKLNRLYYETASIRASKPKKGEQAALLKQLPKTLKGRAARVKRGDRVEVIYGPKVNRLAEQPYAILKALWTASDASYRGAELDLKVYLPSKKTAPVTVRVDLKGDLTAELGQWVKRPIPKSAKEIEQRWKVGPLKAQGAEWSKKALRSIDLALSLLSTEERAVLEGIPFARRKRGKQKEQAALYIQQGDCDAFIQIYNHAIASERYTFAGDAQAPMPATVHPIVHEIGHALHNRPSRIIQCRLAQRIKAHNARVKVVNRSKGAKREQGTQALKRDAREIKQLKKQVKQLQGKGPVLTGFQEALGRAKAPTRYGETSLAEAFAESFALYRVDPEALKRVLPTVHAWFEAKGHLKGLRPPRSA